MAERRMFTLEFKREAVRLVTERKLSIPEAARQLGVGPNLIRKWRQALEAGGKQVSSEKKDQTALEEENRRLRAENERLRMEREILPLDLSIPEPSVFQDSSASGTAF